MQRRPKDSHHGVDGNQKDLYSSTSLVLCQDEDAFSKIREARPLGRPEGRTLTPSPSLSLTLSHSLTHPGSLSLPLPLSLALALSFSFSFSFSPSLSLSLTHSITQALSTLTYDPHHNLQHPSRSVAASIGCFHHDVVTFGTFATFATFTELSPLRLWT